MLRRRSVSSERGRLTPVGPDSESVLQRSVPERMHPHPNVMVIKHVLLNLVLVSA